MASNFVDAKKRHAKAQCRLVKSQAALFYSGEEANKEKQAEKLAAFLQSEHDKRADREIRLKKTIQNREIMLLCM